MFTVSGPASRVLYSLDDLVYGKIISTTNMLWAERPLVSARAITATDLLVDGHNLRIAACLDLSHGELEL